MLHAPTVARASVPLALLVLCTVACESPGSNADSDDERTQSELTEESSKATAGSTSSASDERESACSREALEEFASRDLPTYPERPTAVGRFLEFRDRCGESLPDGIREWFELIDEDDIELPEPGTGEAMARRVESLCPAALETVADASEPPDNDRLNGLYQNCDLADLGLAEEDVFEQSTGWRAAIAAAVVLEWLREADTDEALARKTAQWLGGMGEEQKFGPRDLEAISRHHPDLRLPVANIDNPSLVEAAPLVLDQNGVWQHGEQVLKLDGGSGDREKLARHIRRYWRPSTRHVRSFRELHVALDGRAPFELLPRLLGAALDGGYVQLRLLTFHDFSFDAVGGTVDPAEVEGHFAPLPVRRPRPDAELREYRPAGTIHITRRGHDIRGPDGPIPPRGGCPDDGPTVCLAFPETDALADRYDWLGLYRVAAELAETRGRRSVELTASDDIPLRIWIKSAAAIFHELDIDGASTLEDATPKRNREGTARWLLRPTVPIE